MYLSCIYIDIQWLVAGRIIERFFLLSDFYGAFGIYPWTIDSANFLLKICVLATISFALRVLYSYKIDIALSVYALRCIFRFWLYIAVVAKYTCLHINLYMYLTVSVVT